MKEILKYAWKEIKRRKSRSLGNILGYVIAVAFLIVTLTFARFSWFGTNTALQYTGAQFIGFIYATSQHKSDIRFINPEKEGFFIFNNPVVLFPATLIDEIRKSPNVKNASPLLTFTISTAEPTGRSRVIAGFDPANMESLRMVSCSATDIVEGRLIEPGDSSVVLLEQTFADVEQYRVDDIIYLTDREFKVQGILSPGTRPAKADIYMPFKEAMEVLNTRIEKPVGNVANLVLVDGAGALITTRAIHDVREILGFNSSTVGYSCFAPAGAAIGITFRGMRILGLIVFSGIFLLIMVSQYYSVLERHNDIGILKAIGWPDKTVISQIFAESFIQSFLGGLIGSIVALLFLILFPVGDFFGNNETLNLYGTMSIVLTGYVLAALVGALTGALAAIHAAGLQPAEILRKL